MRCVFVFVLAACSVPSPAWPLSRCDPHGIYVGADVETAFGRLQKTVARVYPSATVDMLTRTIQTDWEPVPITQRSVHGAHCIVADTIIAFDAKFTVTLEGSSPFEVRVDSRARGHETFVTSGLVHRTFPTELDTPERELAALIRSDLADLAVRCDNTVAAARCDRRPVGSPSDFAVPALPTAVVIAAPRLCANDAAYIKVERTTGMRPLGVGRTHGTSGAIGTGCNELSHDHERCSSINVVTFAYEVARRMRREGINVGGVGVGECGNAHGAYDALDFSVKVFAWKDAGPAAAILAEVLAEYDLRGFAGISVGGRTCGTAG
jgi:hypothetical protein